MPAFRILEFLDERHRSPFRRWFDALDAAAAGRVTAALYRMEQGNFANVKWLGQGLAEYRINAGPGYRIYFGRIDVGALLLLGGGTKRTQRRDIEVCRERWRRRITGKQH